jgi:hypothetical protein
LLVQLAVKIGWTAPENDTLGPQVHMPDEHVWPRAQALPHLPQLFVSLEVSAHVLPQSVPPFGQMQLPDWHVWAFGQT